MFWWRGNGLLIGFLACIPAVAATQLGATHPAMAYLASAVLIYLLRDMLGEQSALFSIPTKFWPPLLLVVALVVHFSPPSGKQRPKGDVASQMAKLQASLPRKLTDQLRLDAAQLDGKMLHGEATSLSSDGAGATRMAHEQALRRFYCDESPFLSKAQISLSVRILLPPRRLNDRVESMPVQLDPQACPAASTSN